jgi:hypothetical protein
MFVALTLYFTRKLDISKALLISVSSVLFRYFFCFINYNLGPLFMNIEDLINDENLLQNIPNNVNNQECIDKLRRAEARVSKMPS